LLSNCSIIVRWVVGVVSFVKAHSFQYKRERCAEKLSTFWTMTRIVKPFICTIQYHLNSPEIVDFMVKEKAFTTICLEHHQFTFLGQHLYRFNNSQKEMGGKIFQWLFWAWEKYDEVEVLNYRSVPTLPRTARKQRPYYFM